MFGVLRVSRDARVADAEWSGWVGGKEVGRTAGLDAGVLLGHWKDLGQCSE